MTDSSPDSAPSAASDSSAGRRWQDRSKRLAHDLVQIGPAPHAHRVAIRAATALGVPLLVLWWSGRLDLTAYATFGAFASIYGGGARDATRWRVQARLGGILTLAVISGAMVGLSEWRSWLAIPIAAAWASAAAALSDRQRWRPPGPMFPVFAVATASAIPSTPTLVLEAGGVVGATAVFAVVLGVGEVLLLRSTGLRPADPPALPGPPMPSMARQRIHLIRCGVVVIVAGSIATASAIGHPYWAMVAAVTPLTVFTFRGQIIRGIHRVAGTAVGLALAAGLLLLPIPTLILLIMFALFQALIELLVVRHYGLALIFITPLALLSVQLANPEPIAQLITDRFAETIIGVAVGLAAAIVTRNRETATG